MTVDPHIQQRRQDYLDAIYHLDGRNDPAHPRHATYTGLFQQRLALLVSQDMEATLDAPHAA